MKFKKIILPISLGAVVGGPVAVVSCSASSGRGYDLGVTTNAISSLNYLKYQQSTDLVHGFVESFVKMGPQYESSLSNYLSDIPNIWTFSSSRYNNISISTNSMTSGTLKPTETNATPFPAFSFETLYENSKLSKYASKFFTLRLNGKSKWENGDLLTPSNYIDAFIYIVDLNTGSQITKKLLSLNIKNAREFVNAQSAYSKKYETLYKNPFGYIENDKYDPKNQNSVKWVQRKDEFPLQKYASTPDSEEAKEERNKIKNIEFYARNIGIYGDENSSHPRSHLVWANDKTKNDDPEYANIFSASQGNKNTLWDDDFEIDNPNDLTKKVKPNIFQIQTEISKEGHSFLRNSLGWSAWLPVNRKFVEEVGGVEKFGLNKDKFLTQGPFKIDEIILGSGGSIVLKKDDNYWNSKNTIPNKVKIFFQDNIAVTSSLFEDGFISNTNLNSVSVLKQFATSEYRPLIKKSGGDGTTAFVFNQAKSSEGYSEILGDPDLRKAIFYATRRDDIISLSGFDSSLPAYSFIDSAASIGRKWTGGHETENVASVFSRATYKDKYDVNNPKPVVAYKFNDYFSKNLLISNLNKKDIYNNDDLARIYFKKFQEKFPGSHTIEYSHDSSKALIQIGVALKSRLNDVFDGKLELKIKGYPKAIYDSFFTAGNFQLTYRNLDYLATAAAGNNAGVLSFYIKDTIDKTRGKLNGFIDNPTGDWTIDKIVMNDIDNLTDDEKEIKERLNISDFVWNKIYGLSHITNPLAKNLPLDDQDLYLSKKINAFSATSSSKFTYFENGEAKSISIPLDENFATQDRVNEVTIASSLLLMEASPIIPLFVVDNKLLVSRIVNYKTSVNTLVNYDYGYDYKFKPRNDLPGREALVG